jgi:hypothetical protein
MLPRSCNKPFSSNGTALESVASRQANGYTSPNRRRTMNTRTKFTTGEAIKVAIIEFERQAGNRVVGGYSGMKFKIEGGRLIGCAYKIEPQPKKVNR